MKVLLAAIVPAAAPNLPPARALPGVIWERTNTAEDAFALLSDYPCDAVVVPGAPDAASLQAFVRKVRLRDKTIPILILGLDGAVDRIACLDVGADDVVPSNCTSSELLARLHAIVRRSKGHGSSNISIGNLRLDVARASVDVMDRPFDLTRKEYRLLEMLVLGAGRSISKGALMDGLYLGGEERDEGVIGVFLCMVRKKLRAAGADVEIETFRGVGYCLRKRPDTAPRHLVAAMDRSQISLHPGLG